MVRQFMSATIFCLIVAGGRWNDPLRPTLPLPINREAGIFQRHFTVVILHQHPVSYVGHVAGVSIAYFAPAGHLRQYAPGDGTRKRQEVLPKGRGFDNGPLCPRLPEIVLDLLLEEHRRVVPKMIIARLFGDGTDP